MSRFGIARPLLAMAMATTSSPQTDRAHGAARSPQRPNGPGERLMSAGTLCGDRVVNRGGELLGTVSELLLDVDRGCIAYVVMAYGGFMGLGERLFALPWSALELNVERGWLILDAERSTFDTAPAFDKQHWPSTPDAQWHRDVHRHYGSIPYWD
ncbi:PRC-barrel domain-containing protein [Methylibium sp.]|uniref:PRC-barrel domain-containing protein n=1 Tax=Methylibium sp. TaxID=2067992 RepID=UPI0025D78DE1|nr:PRC-barrel domain-containing protein [Methylibium sp.]